MSISYSGGCCWKCAFCAATIPNVPAHSQTSCPFCHELQPGYSAEPGPSPSPSRSPAADVGEPGSQVRSDLQSGTGTGSDSTVRERSQRSDQEITVTTQQQKKQGTEQMEVSYRQQPLSHEQLLQYEQQLIKKEGMLKQHYEQEVQQLNYLESICSGQQLGPDQQQQLVRQSTFCRQLWDELLVLWKQQQELHVQLKVMLKAERGLPLSHGHQPQQQLRMILQGGQWVPVGHCPWQQQHNQQGKQQQAQQKQQQAPQQILRAENNQRPSVDKQQEDEQRQLIEQQQRERKLALLDSQQKKLLDEQQKKIEEEQIRLEQQKKLQQQQHEVDPEIGDVQMGDQQQFNEQQEVAGQQGSFEQQGRDSRFGCAKPSHDQQRQDEEQHIPPEKHGGVQKQEPSNNQNQPTGDKYEQTFAQQRKSQTEDTLQQQGEGEQKKHGPQQTNQDQNQHTGDEYEHVKQEYEQRRLLEQQVNIQTDDAQLGNQRQHDQQEVSSQQQSFEQGGGNQPSHDQQQLLQYQEQLAEKQKVLRMLKQQYKQELDKLKSMELNSSGQQLGHDQQQQLWRQKMLCQQLLNDLQALRKEEQKLHGQQLKLMLKAERGKQLSHDRQTDDGKLGNQQQEVAGRQQSFERQGRGSQPSHDQQRQDEQQHTLPEKHGGVQNQEPIHEEIQYTGDKDKGSVKKQILAWENKSQMEDSCKEQQLRMQQHRQESKQQQRSEQQHEQNRTLAQNQQERYNDHQDGDVVYCNCGAAFHPNARACANTNCGKPRPRNEPQGPPCVHCGKRLIKEGAIRCESCNKKQSEMPAKPPEGGGTGLGHGYGPNSPQQQLAMMPPNTQQQQASSTQDPNSPSTDVSGALPSNKGNDGDENQAIVGQLPDVPDSARPTKDQSANGQDWVVLPPCTTHPLSAEDPRPHEDSQKPTVNVENNNEDKKSEKKRENGAHGNKLSYATAAATTQKVFHELITCLWEWMNNRYRVN